MQARVCTQRGEVYSGSKRVILQTSQLTFLASLFQLRLSGGYEGDHVSQTTLHAGHETSPSDSAPAMTPQNHTAGSRPIRKHRLSGCLTTTTLRAFLYNTSPEGVDETKARVTQAFLPSPQTGDVVTQPQSVTTAGPEEGLLDQVPLWGAKPGPRSQNHGLRLKACV